jgi:uncharacterized protein
MKNKLLLLFSLLLLLCGCSRQQDASAQNNFPKPTGVVCDFEKILSANQADTLAKMINELKNKTGHEICIVTTSNFAPFNSALEYGTALGNEWGVGKKGKDNGLVIVLSTSLREDAIATGKGTAEQVSDEMCNTIRENNMLPSYKKAEFYEGLKNGLTELEKILK